MTHCLLRYSVAALCWATLPLFPSLAEKPAASAKTEQTKQAEQAEAPAHPPSRSERLQNLDTFITSGMKAWNAPGLSIAIVHKGQVVLSKGYGVREAGKPEPVDAQTLFAIGSTSKAFTAAALGILVDKGKLKWDSRVAELWPEYRLSDPWVTRELRVSDLLANHSGLSALSEGLWYNTTYDRAEIIRRLQFVPFEESFRYTFQYRNVMFLSAGELIPRVDGRSWDTFIEQEIFTPLRMTRSTPTEVGIEKRKNVAQPHLIDYSGEPLPVPYRAMTNIGPAGSIISCADDMAQWLQSQLGSSSFGVRELLKPETLATIQRSHTPFPNAKPDHGQAPPPHTELGSYALSWVTESYKGQRIVWHNGSIDGMSAWVGLVPDEKLGVAILTNLNECELRRALFYQLVDTFTAQQNSENTDANTDSSTLIEPLLSLHQASLKARDEAEAKWLKWSKAPAPTKLPLTAYTGRYSHPALGEIEIGLDKESNTLFFQKTPLQTLDMASTGKNGFMARYRSLAADLHAGKVDLVFTVKNGIARAVIEDETITYQRLP